MTKKRLTNQEFGDLVGCDFTMASRLRSGDRLPSRDLLTRIKDAFGLDGGEALDAASKGRKAFALYLAQAESAYLTRSTEKDRPLTS